MKFDYPYAGLILPDLRDIDPAPYLDSAARVLAKMDPRPDAKAPVLFQDDHVLGSRLGIAVTAQEISDFGPRVVLVVVTVDGTPPEDAEAAALLSATVRAALAHSSADILEWYSRDVLIDCEDFLRLHALETANGFKTLDQRTEDMLFAAAESAQDIRTNLYTDRAAPSGSVQATDYRPAHTSILKTLFNRMTLGRFGRMNPATG